MNTLKKAFRIVFKTLLGFIAFIAIYVLLAWGLSKIEVNSDVSNPNQEVAIYISTNGVHTDIVVPIKNEIKDWTTDIDFKNTKTKDSIMNFVGIGWGDKGFYLNTPEWADLKVSTALTAATGIGSTAMHTTFYKAMKEDATCKKIQISKQDYQALVHYISDSFQKNTDSKTINIPNNFYGKTDTFYEANGSYSIFKTCNTWANGALKSANQKAALWTATDTGIFCHYQK
jgi:uncharacterized protein (TIGR02117 family)